MIAAARDQENVADSRKRPKLEDDDPSSSAKRAKFERSFVSSWLEKYDWLRYDNSLNLMFCVLCIKYQKSNAFTEGCQNFRRDNLNKHINTNDHKVSCRQESGNLGQRPLSACSLGNCSISSVPSSQRSNTSDTELLHCPGSSSDSSQSEEAARSPLPFNLQHPQPSVITTSSNARGQTPSPLDLKEPLFTQASPYIPLSMSFLPRLPFYSYPKHLSMLLLVLFRCISWFFFHSPGELNGSDAAPAAAKDDVAFTPNYLMHPPFPYASVPTTPRPMEPPNLMSMKLGDHLQSSRLPAMSPYASGVTDLDGKHSLVNTSWLLILVFLFTELVIKIRIANSAERDFIEVELDRKRLTYENLMTTMCSELQVNRTLVHKIRKLPDTIVRKDKDVKRFHDFQDLELVLTNKTISESSRNYHSAVSPRHVDVVY